MIVPTLAREWALWRSGARRVAGVDEVGMACLAGPVVACALVVKPYCRKIPGVRDSKTLSLPQRERLYTEILRRAAAVGVGAASVAEINEINILRASHLAMWRALKRVKPVDHALIDGRDFREIDVGPHTAIVDGDALSYAIASASIVAKVTRDRLMHRLAQRHQGYGWEQNVGYPTRDHREAIRRLGITPHHRRAFGTVRMLSQLTLNLEFETVDVARLDSLDTVVLETETSLEPAPV
jgi:ribonuclease HII